MNHIGQQLDFVETAEQFRMTRLQVHNWGTFDGLHNIPISDKGFLFIGRSGSGKTTLLDAISAVLVPPRWMDFNAAARESTHRGRDRDWVTYVRGAWAERKDDDSGEIATHYLRKGSVWSGLALTYQSTLDRVVTLVEILWIRGNSTAVGDVRRHYIIFERRLELTELEDFDLDLRKLKLALPDGVFFENFNPYRERFGRILGIEKEMALRLLHKTQSAKNLGDLNSFLRDFMLDQPATYDAADRLVGEFAELNEAHQAVVTARKQVSTLLPARQQYERRQDVNSALQGLEHLQGGIDPYRETLRKGLIEKQIATLRVRIEGLTGQRDRRGNEVENRESALRDLEDRHRQLGGGQIERLETEREQKERLRADRSTKCEQAREACRRLEWPLSESPEAFARLVGQARQELERRHEQARQATEARDTKKARLNELDKEFQDIRGEIESMRLQPSNIQRPMLELRRELAAQLGLSDDVLPFVGELIEVLPEESEWRGAIERVLHSFALSVLVEDRHYTALSNHVNDTDLNRRRLVYYRTGKAEFSGGAPIPLISLVRKLKLKEGRHHDWLKSELRKRFDYDCVPSAQALRHVERGLTREGQVRHGPHRHEKDDRHRIDDRFHWVLGFDNREKRALYEKRGQELASTIDALNRDIAAIEQRGKHWADRVLHCNTLANLRWDEIDVGPVVERIAAIKQELETIRAGNLRLAEIAQAIDTERRQLAEARDDFQETEVELREADRQRQDALAHLEKIVQLPAGNELTPAQSEGLDSRFETLGKTATIENLAELANRVERDLNHEIRGLSNERIELEKGIERQFAEFIRSWPAESADADATLSSAPDFLGKLNRLEKDGLPEYEERFFKLLKDQSNQNLASLNTQLREARREIHERLELVNEGLRLAAFNEGTHLCIEVSDRNLPEVRDFRREVHEALSHAWTDDHDVAESRFSILSELVRRMASQEIQDRRWREAVLDVRQHVEFIARELDDEGREIEIYRGGGGKSGGQRQKLATTCLAAALKYQLGGADQAVPTYAPVVLDEAFDKADHDYTKMAMEIFRKLGFQMIVATPLKSVMTLEPFIGGACFVDIGARQKSGVLMIEYDEETKRLDLPEKAHGDPSIAVS